IGELVEFNLLTPVDGFTADLNDLALDFEVEITWEELDGTVEYVWHVGLAGADFTDADQILLSIPTADAATELVLTVEALDDALAGLNVAAGATIELSWTVTAEDADENITFAANGPFDLTLTRIGELVEFNLLTPANGFTADLNDLALDFEVPVTWEALDGTTEYVWHVGLAGADFTNPNEILESISAGTSTELILTVEAIDELLAELGIAAGATIELSWTVTAEDADENITFAANGPFDLTLTRIAEEVEALTLPFFEGFEDAAFPPSGWNIVNLEGANTWVRSTAQANSGTASAFISFNGNEGNDFLITPQIDAEGQDAIFSFSVRKNFTAAFEPDSLIVLISTTGNQVTDFTERLFQIDVANLPASVWNAFSTDLSAFAGTPFWIAFQHKNEDGNGMWLDDVSIRVPTFNLLTPEDGTIVDLNDFEPADEITITWEEFDGTEEYVWHAGLAGADFTDAEQILLSIPAGNTPELVLTAQAIDDALASLDIEEGETVALSWTVTAELADESIVFANQTFNITITRIGVAFCNQVFELPFIETAEEDSETVGCFGINFVSGTSNWQLLSDVGAWGTSSRSFRFPFFSVFGGNITDLITPQFEPTVAGATLRFDHAYATFEDEVDQLLIFAIVEGEEIATLVATLDGGIDGPLVTAAPSDLGFVPTRTQWGTASLDLPLNTTRLVFRAVSAFGNHLYIDNIAVGNEVLVGTFDLLTPANRTAVNLEDFVEVLEETNVNVSWSALAGATEYRWELFGAGAEFTTTPAHTVTTTETNFDVSLEAIDGILAGLGLEVGASIDTDWRVVAINGGDEIPSNQVFRLSLTRPLTIGIVELANNELLKVFPNPTNGNFMLEGKTERTVRQIEIVNGIGQTVEVKMINRPLVGLEQFDIANQARGIYFVRLVFDNEIATFKLIKN
ncbi:MAG: choice-of-anchor J domain-containing protein, partial [Luteibaculaceae bacterium]